MRFLLRCAALILMSPFTSIRNTAKDLVGGMLDLKIGYKKCFFFILGFIIMLIARFF